MGTHALVYKKTERGYLGIEISYDGFVSHVGKILHLHYTTETKIDELILMGNLSSIGETIEECESYYSRGEAYEDNKPKLFEKNPKYSHNYSYVYVYEEGEWTVTHGGTDILLKDHEEITG